MALGGMPPVSAWSAGVSTIVWPPGMVDGRKAAGPVVQRSRQDHADGVATGIVGKRREQQVHRPSAVLVPEIVGDELPHAPRGKRQVFAGFTYVANAPLEPLPSVATTTGTEEWRESTCANTLGWSVPRCSTRRTVASGSGGISPSRLSMS
jgi:hypothetical protein